MCSVINAIKELQSLNNSLCYTLSFLSFLFRVFFPTLTRRIVFIIYVFVCLFRTSLAPATDAESFKVNWCIACRGKHMHIDILNHLSLLCFGSVIFFFVIADTATEMHKKHLMYFSSLRQNWCLIATNLCEATERKIICEHQPNDE